MAYLSTIKADMVPGENTAANESANRYHGISLPEWLDIILEYSLEMGRSGNPELAYQYLDRALSTKPFATDPEALLAIHISWFGKPSIVIIMVAS